MSYNRHCSLREHIFWAIHQNSSSHKMWVPRWNKDYKHTYVLAFSFWSLSGSWTKAKKSPICCLYHGVQWHRSIISTWEAESRSWVWWQPGQHSKICLRKQNVPLRFWGPFIKKMKGKLLRLQDSISLGRSVIGAWGSIERLALGFQWPSETVQLKSSKLKSSNKLSKCGVHPEDLLIHGLIALLSKLIQWSTMQTAGWHFRQGLTRY